MTKPVFLSPDAARKTYARLTIDRPGAMTPLERSVVAAWLLKQSRDLVDQGPTYTDTGRFTARMLRTARGLEAR